MTTTTAIWRRLIVPSRIRRSSARWNRLTSITRTAEALSRGDTVCTANSIWLAIFQATCSRKWLRPAIGILRIHRSACALTSRTTGTSAGTALGGFACIRVNAISGNAALFYAWTTPSVYLIIITHCLYKTIGASARAGWFRGSCTGSRVSCRMSWSRGLSWGVCWNWRTTTIGFAEGIKASIRQTLNRVIIHRRRVASVAGPHSNLRGGK